MSKTTHPILRKRSIRDEKGSLALEHILFIGAVVALSAGLFAFYDNLADYFRNIGFAAPPPNIGASSGADTGN